MEQKKKKTGAAAKQVTQPGSKTSESEPQEKFISATDFKKEVLEYTDDMVVVFFYAQWCGPCLVLLPGFRELAEENAAANNTKFLIIDVEKNPKALSERNVRAIPTVMYFYQGKEVGSITGAFEKVRYQDTLDNLRRKHCRSSGISNNGPQRTVDPV